MPPRPRRQTVTTRIGQVRVGSCHPIVVQSMTNTDTADVVGTVRQVAALAPAERRAELHRRFETALGKKKFDVNDVPAARDYVAAYVSFFKYAEGEDHEHHQAHGPDAHAHHGAAHRH